MKLLLCLCLILVVSATVYHVEYDSHKKNFKVSEFKTQFAEDVATVSFTDSIEDIGWSTLKIVTNPRYDDSLQASAAGFGEGFVTYYRIHQHYTNIYSINFGNRTVPEDLHDFLQKQLTWMQMKVFDHDKEEDQYWYNVDLVLKQLQGMVQGYNVHIEDEKQRLSLVDLYMLNSDGDMETLLDIYLKNVKSEFRTGYDCSGLIKRVINPDTNQEELFMGHATWRNYAAMMRVFKYYELHYNSKYVPATLVGFSSSPGFISSKDDYYTTSQNITAMETTNSVFDEELYKNVVPSTVPTWIRSVIACRMATRPHEWIEIFGKYNSGTYNNQWMALDMFGTSKQTEDVLVISEQIPGHYIIKDVTSILNDQTYWASYNIPYIPEIYELSGYVEKAINNTDYSYEKCSRAQIFRRDHDKVVDLKSMEDIMMYNDYLNDPLSDKKPNNAIASRYDLRESSPSSFGAIDAKITYTSVHQNAITYAISGPTHINLPPFDWTEFEKKQPNVPSHIGVPNRFEFDYVEMNPEAF